MTRAPTLRAIVAAITLVGTLIAMAICASLIFLTTLLHQATVTAATGVESVRLASDAQLDLMLLARADDHLVREDLLTDMRGKLAGAREGVMSDAEERALSAAVSQVDALTAESNEAQATQEVFARLNRFIALNTQQAERALARAARWDRVGTLLGILGGVLFLVAAIGLVLGARAAVRPLLALDDAMRRFGQGDADARAAESGPGEIREMAARFNDMASALSAQRRAQTAFLGGVAHDLRNPLGTLKLAVALLPEEDAEIVARIDRQIHRLERMVGDFLDASEIEAGKLALRLDTADARSVAKEAVGLFEAASPDHTLTLALPSEAMPLRCDPLRMEQVLANLISNALKYSPDGGRVEVRVRAAGEEAVFEVSDEGMGISEEDRRRLFEPFRRVGLSKETIPGVGLGLYVVRQIVEAHGGRIEVTSSPGRGSTFRVIIGGLLNRREEKDLSTARRFLRPRTT
jgi:signal transduction histidine kinase